MPAFKISSFQYCISYGDGGHKHSSRHRQADIRTRVWGYADGESTSGMVYMIAAESLLINIQHLYIHVLCHFHFVLFWFIGILNPVIICFITTCNVTNKA